MGFFDKIQDTISTATEQTKAKAQDVQLKRDRKQKLEVLGEQVYNLYMNGQLTAEELAPACQEIDRIDQEIAAAEAQAKAARPPAPQPQPGAPAAQAPAPQAPPPPPSPPRAAAPPPPPPQAAPQAPQPPAPQQPAAPPPPPPPPGEAPGE